MILAQNTACMNDETKDKIIIKISPVPFYTYINRLNYY